MLPAPSPKETCEDKANEAKKLWPQLTDALRSRGDMWGLNVCPTLPLLNLFSSSYMRQGWAWSSLSPAVSGLVPPPAWAPGLAEVAQLVMVGLVGVSPGHCWAPREGLLSGWSFQEPRAGGLPRGLSSPLDHVQLHAEFLPSAPQCGMAGPFPGWGQLLQPSLQPSLHGRRCPSLPL